MPIQRNINIDLRRKEICALYTAPAGLQVGSGYVPVWDEEPERRNARALEGYKPSVSRYRTIPQMSQTAKLPLFVTREAELQTFVSGRRIRDFEVTDFEIVDIKVEVRAILSLRDNPLLPLDPAIEAQIEIAFSNTNLDFSDVNQAESAIIAAGAKVDDYWVDLILRVSSPAYIVPSIIRFEEAIKNFEAATDNYGKNLYRVGRNNKQPRLACTGAASFPDEDILKTGPKTLEEALVEKWQSEMSGCEGLKSVDNSICNWTVPELKVKLERIEINVCGVHVGWMDVPVLWVSNTRSDLVGSALATRDIVNHYEKIIKQALIDAAIATAIVVVFTEGITIGAAGTMYCAAVMVRLEDQLPDGLDCITPDLNIVAQDRNWTRV